MADEITGTILKVERTKTKSGGDRTAIHLDDGTTQRWLSTFDLLGQEFEEGGRYKLKYVTKPNANNPASPYYNLESWEKVGNGAVSAPPKPTPQPTPSPSGGDVPEDVAVEGIVRGHVENLAIQLYIGIEGVSMSSVDEVDLFKIRQFRDKVLHELTLMPVKSARWWKFHYCEQHQIERFQSPRSGKWLHRMEGGYGVEFVTADGGTTYDGCDFIPNPAREPEPKPEPAAVLDMEELP